MPGASAFAASCEGLLQLQLPQTTIVSAQVVAAGAFTPPTARPDLPGAAPFKSMPPFCRVVAQLKPSADSDIQVEVWMPVTGWNGKYQGQGNGGFAGSIGYGSMAEAVKQGYATAGTDTGHQGAATDAEWALGHPEKVIDFSYRGVHEMTVKAKAIIQAFYGDAPRRSYFSSCSDGGREALMEAQRFPQDYDGIIAGAPAYFWTHLLVTAIWNVQATEKDPGSYVPAAKIPALAAAVVAACDRQDGVADGVLNDPRQCRFHPAILQCKGADSDACLTAPQVAAVKKIYGGPETSQGKAIFFGLSPGGEAGPGGWPLWITGAAPAHSLQYQFGTGFFRNMMYADRNWDFRNFKFDSAVKAVDQKQAATLNATNPDLRAFKARGGKLILYHGWSDAAIPPLSTIAYYDRVVAAMGSSSTESFSRLYMAPGMQHCSGGPGASSFGQVGSGPVPRDPQHNIRLALEQWVEQGVAPGEIIATKYVDARDPAAGAEMTRPLCPYPQVANYKGKGDTHDAASFECVGK
jgi:feruloyl esterase